MFVKLLCHCNRNFISFTNKIAINDWILSLFLLSQHKSADRLSYGKENYSAFFFDIRSALLEGEYELNKHFFLNFEEDTERLSAKIYII